MTVPTRRWPVLALWLAALAALAVWNLLTVRPSTDLSQFLPHAASEQDRVLLSQVRGGVAARTLLLRIGGSDGGIPNPARLAAASRALAERMRGSGGFAQVANGDVSEIASETDAALFSHRYLIGPAASCSGSLDEASLHAALERRLDELVSGLAILDKQRIASDPTACYRQILRSLAPSDGPTRHDGVWVSPDRRHALLVAITKARASDLAAQGDAVRGIETAFAELPQCDGLTLDLAGPGYFAVGSEQRIKSETVVLSTAASLLVALILALAFRSATLVLLGILPLASGVLVGTALVSAGFGFVHGITLGLGVTLLGVALDYPVHVYAHARRVGQHRELAIWRTLLLGMISTVLGYGALAWTSFDGLSQLGILAAAGLATAALTSRYLLPPLMPPGYRLPQRRWLIRMQPRLPSLSPGAGIALLLLLLASLGTALMLRGSPWETDIRRLSTVPLSEIEKDQQIRAQLGAPDVARLLYVVADDQDGVLERLEAAQPDLEALRARGLISAFDSAARWLPSPATQRSRQAALPDPSSLRAALAAANADLPFRVERLAPFLADVATARSQSPLRREGLSGSLVGTRIEMLLAPIADRWLGLVPLSGVDGESAVAALRELAASHGMHYLNLRNGTADLLSGFFAETLDKLALAAALIVLTLVVALRDMARLLRVMLPIAIALVVTFDVVILVQGAVNLFHLVSLLLVAGLAIDYGLFLSRPAGDREERGQTLFSVSVGALSSFAMFALLALSEIPALRAIGFTVATGILVAYAASLVLARPRKVWLE